MIHVPSLRPTVDDLLNSQFVTHPNLSMELIQQEINASLQTNAKKLRLFWTRSKSSRVERQHSLERYLETNNKPAISMNTKQSTNNGLLISNFLQPIDLSSNCPDSQTNSEHNNMISKNKLNKNSMPRKSFLCGNLKKKVVPIEVDKEKESVNAYTSNGKADQWGAIVPLEDSCGLFKNYDLETGDFVMMPTRQNKSNGAGEDNCLLTALERETRQILSEFGINDEMLESACKNAPRSDIIGIYRIVLNRLQKQSWSTRKHVQLALQEMPKVEKKIERSCCIL